MARTAYPSDVSDEAWALVTPSLTLMTADAPHREHSLREVFHGLRWLVRAGAARRMMPHDLPPWPTVYQQSQRWLQAGICDAIVQDLARCCSWPRAARRNPRRRSAIAARCNRRPQVAREQGMTAPNVAGARRCIGRSRPWAICWRSMSPPPVNRTGATSHCWLPQCKK
jgi:transposase